MSTVQRSEVEPEQASWTIEDARALYRVEAWSEGYFGVSPSGTVVAGPDVQAGRGVDLLEVVHGLRDRGITPPVLLRFSDILAHRLRALHDAFDGAMRENDYKGAYTAVYPIKVNQQRQVVDEIARIGRVHGFGLEVGSKPELLAVLALTSGQRDQLIVCNGFKDAPYIEAVVLASKLGRRIVPVVESLREAELIIKYAEQYGVRPSIGVRVKLASKGAGRWKDSAGAKSKFGLFVSELLSMMDLLRDHGMLDCLRLLHCHSGSQLHDIQNVKGVIAELAHVYVQLVREGAGLEFLDVGGGLAVDYTGGQTNDPSSMNYSVQEYASDVVYRIGSICSAAGVDHPTIVTECGRAMVAHSSVLVFDVLGATGPRELARQPVEDPTPDTDEPRPIKNLRSALANADPERLLESYHDAIDARDEAMTLFGLGYFTLRQRAVAERLFWTVCLRIRELCAGLDEVPDELLDLDDVLSDTYFCNFSLFQSLPDSWAIDQVFPTMPIQRLDERPTRRAVLADITCDSDGRIDRFAAEGGEAAALDVHELDGRDYYLGVFIVGAYQETLGDLHNLFGDAHAVHIRLEEGRWVIEEIVKGDTAGEVLSYVQYDPERFESQMRRDCERAVGRGAMTVRESQALLRFYETGLGSYTYLQS